MPDGVDLGSAYGRIELDGSQAMDTVNSLASSMRSAGAAMSAAVTLPLVGIGVAAVNSAGEFEQSMNIMAQVSGATGNQMAALQAQALEMGAVTSFSAGEAAQAQLELAKAGLAPMEVLAALPGVLDMAAAGGMGVAESATIAANAVNMFGLEASDTTDVANMLAAAANASSSDITDLAAGMQMAGSVFAANGQTIDDLNIGLALLSNNGIAGSDAGTSLKTAMMRLTAPTDEAAAVMANLGVSAFDAQGNMREFPAIMQDMQQALYGVNEVSVTTSNLTAEQAERMKYLAGTISKTQTQLANYQSGIAGVAQSEADKIVAQDRLNRTLQAAQAEYAQLAAIGGTTSTVMKQLTEEERQQAMATIFGADAIRSASVIMAEGAEGWNEMADALGVAGAATSTAGARMKGMRGAVEYLQGSIDSFLIGTALPFLDSLSGIVRVVADGITAFGSLPRPVIDAGLAFAAVLAAAGPLMLALSGVGAAIAFILSPVGLLVAGVAALAAAFTADFMGIRTAVVGTFTRLAPVFDGIHDVLVEGQEPLGDWSWWWEKMADVVGETAASMISDVTVLVYDIARAIGALAAGDFAKAGGLLRQFGVDLGWLWTDIQGIDWGGALAVFTTGLTTLKVGVVAALQAIDWAAALETATTWLDGLKSGVTSALQSVDWAGALTTAGEWLASLRDGVVAAVTSIPWLTHLATAGNFVSGLTQGVVNRLITINWGALLTQAGDWLAGLRGHVVAALGRIDWGAALTAAATWLNTLKTNVVAAIQGIDWGAALTAAGNAFASLETAVTNGLNALGFSGAATSLANIKAAIGGLPASLTALATNFNAARSAVGAFGVQAAAALAPVAAFFAPAIGRLQAVFAGLPASLAPLQPKLAALGAAFGGLVKALQPLMLLLGGALAIAADFTINRLATAFETLPTIIGTIIDQVTATIQLITTIINSVIAGVQAAIDGDWTAVWESAETIARGFSTFFRGLFSRLGTFMGAVAKNISKPIIDTLTDLGVDVQPLLDGIKGTFDTVWSGIQSAIQAVVDIVGTVTSTIGEFKTFLDGLQLRNPFEGIAAAGQTVLDAIGKVGNAVSGGGEDGDPSTPEAGGTSYFRGGLATVNERGYEQVVLPAGSRVYTHAQTNNMDAAGEGRTININLGGVTVNSPMDAHRLAGTLRDQLAMAGV